MSDWASTRERVRQIETEALAKLAEEIAVG